MADFRSDTVTMPCAGMRDAMARAAVGDDVYGEDPTVRELEETTAEMAGMAAGVFFPSGTQSNLAAVLSHCARGEEFIVGSCYHIFRYEAGGSAALGGAVPYPLQTDSRGGLAAAQVTAAIKADDSHFPRTRLLCLENTINGMAQDAAQMAETVRAAKERGLRAHLDGARLFNAAVSQDVAAKELTSLFDSVSLCLSKGLGAPAGTVLCGSAEFIHTARRNRKLLGGGMRQSGVLAAAGLWALQNNINRLQEAHNLAAELAAGLAKLTSADMVSVDTNMVWFAPAAEDAEPLREHWESCGIRTGSGYTADGGEAMRLVTHLDVDKEDIAATLAAAQNYYRKGA